MLESLIADDFIEYGSSGLTYSKQDILERLQQEHNPHPTIATITDFEIIELSDTLIQSRYKTDKTIDSHTTTSLRSSLWRKEIANDADTGNTWRIFFHQGTPIANESFST